MVPYNLFRSLYFKIIMIPSCFQAILVQIRSEIMSDPNARLDKRNTNIPYDMVEAKRAFERMVSRYKWDK